MVASSAHADPSHSSFAVLISVALEGLKVHPRSKVDLVGPEVRESKPPMLARRKLKCEKCLPRLSGVIGVFLVAGAGSSVVADEAIHYANTCREQESGDVAGYVVIVSQGVPIPSISLSWSEGAMMVPVAAKIHDYDRVSGRLAFSVHARPPTAVAAIRRIVALDYSTPAWGADEPNSA